MGRLLSIASPEPGTAQEVTSPAPSETVEVAASLPEDALAPFLRDEEQRQRDDRRSADEVPWLSSVKLPWGTEVSLLNISRTGMLVETTFKFTPGASTEFHLCGPDGAIVVRARFVRSEVASVDSRSVKYHAAAVFSEELRLNTLGRGNAGSPPKALADLFNYVVGDLDRSGQFGLRARFEQGLRKLVSAREILIRDGVLPPGDTNDSIYFTIPSTAGVRAILQVTFERGRELSQMELGTLQSAATLASLVLEFERMPMEEARR